MYFLYLTSFASGCIYRFVYQVYAYTCVTSIRGTGLVFLFGPLRWKLETLVLQ